MHNNHCHRVTAHLQLNILLLLLLLLLLMIYLTNSLVTQFCTSYLINVTYSSHRPYAKWDYRREVKKNKDICQVQ